MGLYLFFPILLRTDGDRRYSPFYVESSTTFDPPTALQSLRICGSAVCLQDDQTVQTTFRAFRDNN